MELKKDTSNYKINEEDSNKNLKYDLEQLLEKELKKSPNEINAEKIDSIVSLLNQFDGEKDGEDIEKEAFAKKYLQGYIDKPKKESRHGIFISIKAACIILAVMMTLGFGNYLSVKATGNGIFSNIKRKAGKQNKRTAGDDNGVRKRKICERSCFDSSGKTKKRTGYDTGI